MPGHFVFPGGVIEPEDFLPKAHRRTRPPTIDGLDGPTRQDLGMFMRAALRETWEESGLLIGRPARRVRARGDGPWRIYAERGLRPAFEDLILVARAITPSAYPIRFHARFFLAPGELAHGEPSSHGELERVAWVPLGQVGALLLPSVTRLVLREALVQRRLAGPGERRRRIRLFA